MLDFKICSQKKRNELWNSLDFHSKVYILFKISKNAGKITRILEVMNKEICCKNFIFSETFYIFENRVSNPLWKI